MMEDMTPAIEPLSLDEAFMDLGGTARLHGVPPAAMLARLVKRMRDELGLSGSIGLKPQQVPRQSRLGPQQTPRILCDRQGRNRRFPAR